jgi:hypothetical protein
MSDILITIPEKDILLPRLIKVDAESHFVEHLYLAFMNKSGQQFTHEGVIMGIVLDIRNYIISVANESTFNLFGYTMSKKIPFFIRAMVLDDYQYKVVIALYHTVYKNKLIQG